MKIGMLWFDNDPKADLTTKVSRAADYYEKKHGKRPTLCYVHTSALPQAKPAEIKRVGNHVELDEDPVVIAGVEIRVSRSILPNHLWLGEEEHIWKIE